MKIAELYTEITARDAGFKAAMKRTENAAKKVEQSLAGVSRQAQRMLALEVLGAGLFLKIASDFEEANAKFQAVFKEETAAAEEFARALSEEVGRSIEDIKRQMSGLQDTFVPLGYARDRAREMSQQMVKLAIDVASFNNTLEEDTIRDFQSAIVGNHETVRKYGIIITQAVLDQELLNMGFEGGAKAASEQMKVQARLNVIMNGTTDAQGDAARTSGSLANMWKALVGQLKEFAGEIGNTLVPLAKDLVGWIKDIIPPIRDWIKENPVLVKRIILVTGAVTALLAVLAPLAAAVAGLAPILAGIGAPVALATAAFATLIAFAEELIDAYKRAKFFLTGFREEVEKFSAAGLNFSEIDSLISSLKNAEKAKEIVGDIPRIVDSMFRVERDENADIQNFYEWRLKKAKELLDIAIKEDEARNRAFEASRRDKEEELSAAKEAFDLNIRQAQEKKRSLEQELRKANEIKRASFVGIGDISRQIQVAVSGRKGNEQSTLLTKQINNQKSIIEVLKKQLDAILNPEPILAE
jgi:hypothetical protein